MIPIRHRRTTDLPRRQPSALVLLFALLILWGLVLLMICAGTVVVDHLRWVTP